MASEGVGAPGGRCSGEMGEHERIRMVVLGGPETGKSAILKRFLFNTFSEKYRSTVEDLYSKEFDLGPVTIKVDILDTCGDPQFPAMRRLSIATAHAFLLVYAVDSSESLDRLKMVVEELREQRTDFQEVPIVVVGNKLDMAPLHRQVPLEDASEWLFCELPRIRAKLMECSAKEDYNIRDIFKCFVMLSKILPPTEESSLKRRSSAYVSASRQGGGRRAGSPATLAATSANAQGESSEGEGRSKPRSRSLIRRCSRKTKQQIRDSGAHGNSDDCNVS